jgi:hypothetical protein
MHVFRSQWCLLLQHGVSILSCCMFPVLCFRGSRLTAVSCMRAGVESRLKRTPRMEVTYLRL